MSTTTTSISAIGQICATLQRPYEPVRKAIEALDIRPALVINMVAHYDDADVERIRQYLSRGQQPA